MPLQYVVLFAFQADDAASELTVRAGEVVVEADDAGEDGGLDGWLLVQVEADCDRTGYVPSAYVQALDYDGEAPRCARPVYSSLRRAAAPRVRTPSDESCLAYEGRRRGGS